ncbi:MAG TPA: HAD family hydrolase [archaeon]|nr:HAD family hydrolase [archaeon]HLD81428.1 HAD family hydrolase [archaeon]
MIRVISFDLDGTVVDKDFDNVFWFKEVPKVYARKNNVSIDAAWEKVLVEYKALRGHKKWTDPMFWLVEHFDLLEEREVRQMITDLKGNAKLYPDVLPALNSLKGEFELAVLTHSTREFVEVKMQAEQVSAFFSKVFSVPSDLGGMEKDELVYSRLLKEFNASPEEAVHVGDHYRFDYEVPKKVGMHAFYLDRQRERQGEHVVHDLKEFAGKVKALNATPAGVLE